MSTLAPKAALVIGAHCLLAACSSDAGGGSTVDAIADTADVSNDTTDASTPAVTSPRGPGPHAVGVTTETWLDSTRDRQLTVELWYPTSDTTTPVDDVFGFLTEDQASTYRAALGDGVCATTETGAARDVEPLAAAPMPIAMFSHCHDCTRFSSYSIAERLASHGYLVAAVDHTDNTWFERDVTFGIDEAGVSTRALDVRFVLDVLTGVDAMVTPDDVAAAAIANAGADDISLFGHSFGAITTGRVLRDDPRPRVAVAIAAPIDSILLQGIAIDELDRPLLYLLAQEDNSIAELGNGFIRDNQADGVQVWLLEVPDAGHWSFSNLAGIEGFEPGCGDGERQTNGEAFTYLPLADGLEFGADAVTTFLFLHSGNDEAAGLAQAELDDWIATSPDDWTTP